MTRRRAILLLLAPVVAPAGGTVLFTNGGPGPDVATDVGGSLGLVDDPPFQIRLSGPLWRDRSLTSEDGARDLAYVTRDKMLDLRVASDRSAGIAEIELNVDRRPQRHIRPSCPGGHCPATLRAALRPRLGIGTTGDRRVQVVVRDKQAHGGGADVSPHVSVAAFTVHVGRDLPVVREGEPVTATTAQSTAAA